MAVAPPLPPFRGSRFQPNDAANIAWKKHAAPRNNGATRPALQVGSLVGQRSAGGPAPPFLAAPPVIAAAVAAKAEGKPLA